MIQVKILDKNNVDITAFNLGEFGGLNYVKVVGQIGNASFDLDVNNDKVTEVSVRNYNRVEIHKDGEIEWVGYIASKRITFNKVTIQCKEVMGILAKRLVPANYTLSGNAGTAIGTLLAYINGVEDTGITLGLTDVSTSINMTFNQQDAFTIIQNIANAVGAQFIINNDYTLDFVPQIGADKSLEVVLAYNILQPQQANILNFDVSDNGDNVVTRAYGKTSTLSTVQEDIPLKNKYGLLEQFTNFSQANTQPILDSLAVSKLADSLYSPTLNLSPNIEDVFDIGDLVLVKIENKIVSINDTFQVLEKNVKIVNSQKSISIKINKLPQDIVNTIRDLQIKVNLLETN